MSTESSFPSRMRLDVILSQPLYEDDHVTHIVQDQLGRKYEWRKLAYMREEIEVEFLVYVEFAFVLANITGGFLSELGKDLYTTTKRIFRLQREHKRLVKSSPSFFRAHVSVGDIDVELVFQTDAYPDAEGFGAMFDRCHEFCA